VVQQEELEVATCAPSDLVVGELGATCMPSATGVEHDGHQLPLTLDLHVALAAGATGSSSGWSQNRGISIPSCSAARMISVPLGT
jgi:hypothetical protein